MRGKGLPLAVVIVLAAVGVAAGALLLTRRSLFGGRTRALPTRPPAPTRTLAVPKVPNPAPGDVNADGVIDQLDVSYLNDFISGGGQAPLGPADLSGDGKVNAADVFRLTNAVFAGGAPLARPVAPSPAPTVP